MLLWLTNIKNHNNPDNVFIKLNLNDVIDDLENYISNEEIDEIFNLIGMKRNIQSNDEMIETNEILDDFIFNTLNDHIGIVKQVNSNERQFSNFGDIQNYDGYLYFCLNQCFH